MSFLNNEGVVLATSKKTLPNNTWGDMLISHHAYSVHAMTSTKIILYNPYGEVLAPIPKTVADTLFEKFSVTKKL